MTRLYIFLCFLATTPVIHNVGSNEMTIKYDRCFVFKIIFLENSAGLIRSFNNFNFSVFI